MALILYAGKGFDTQKAERFFKERRIAYQRVDALRYGVGRRELETIAAAVGVTNLADRESRVFRESVIAYTDSRETILDGLAQDARLIRLPIVRCGRLATVGCCPEVWAQWIADGKI